MLHLHTIFRKRSQAERVYYFIIHQVYITEFVCDPQPQGHKLQLKKKFLRKATNDSAANLQAKATDGIAREITWGGDATGRRRCLPSDYVPARYSKEDKYREVTRCTHAAVATNQRRFGVAVAAWAMLGLRFNVLGNKIWALGQCRPLTLGRYVSPVKPGTMSKPKNKIPNQMGMSFFFFQNFSLSYTPI